MNERLYRLKLMLSLAAAILGFLAAGGVAAEEAGSRNREGYVSAEVINTQGYDLDVPGLGKMRIVSLKPGRKGGKPCLLHIPSVVAQAKKIKPSGGEIEVRLAFVRFDVDDWGCRGAGDDCVATIVVKK